MGVHVGLDLGGTNVKCAVVDPALRVLATDTLPNGAADGPDAVLERVATLGRAIAEPFGEVLSAGLALPGHFDADGCGVLLPNLPGDWAGRPIAGPVSERLGVPVRLVNDVRALTLAELRLGAGRGASDLVCVALGTGVGGGVVIGGKLFRGWAELGHVVIVEDGEPCRGACSGRGHIEAYCSGRAADALARRVLGGSATARDLVAQRHAALDQVGHHLGVAIGSLVNIFHPQMVVIGGGFGIAAFDLLLPSARLAVLTEALAPAGQQLALEPAILGSQAGLIGAGLVAFEVT